ncbi:unnamed protein product [Coccothraustes coccothraustes]
MLLFQELQLPAWHLSSKPLGYREESQAMQGPRGGGTLPAWRSPSPRPSRSALRTSPSGCRGRWRQVAGHRRGLVSPLQGEGQQGTARLSRSPPPQAGSASSPPPLRP